MKWFKHLSNARNDERIAQLEDAAGLEGYGFYFKLLEIVAQAMNESNNCTVTYSIARWATLTNSHPIKARTLLGKVGSSGLVELRFEGDRAEVRIPNLLKHRDNHSRNLQATVKQEKSREEESRERQQAPPRGGSKSGARLPDDWKLSTEQIEWTIGAFPGWKAEDVLRMEAVFRDYWRGAPGSKGLKADWAATWRNWVRREADRSPPAVKTGKRELAI